MGPASALLASGECEALSLSSEFGTLACDRTSLSSQKAREFALAFRRASEAESRNVASAVASLLCGAHSNADARLRCCCVTEKELLRLYTENCVLCRRIRALAPAIGELQARVEQHEVEAVQLRRISEEHRAALEAVERNKEELARQKEANEELSRRLDEEVRTLRESHNSLSRQQKLELEKQRLAFEEKIARGREKADGICQSQQEMLERQRKELEDLQKKHDSLVEVLQTHELAQRRQSEVLEGREAICDRQGRDISALLRESRELQLQNARLESKAAACEEASKAGARELRRLQESQERQDKAGLALAAAQRESEGKILQLQKSHEEQLLQSSKEMGGLLTWRKEQSEAQKDLLSRQSSLQEKLDLIQQQQLKQMQLQEERQIIETQFRAKIQEEIARVEKRLAERRVQCPSKGDGEIVPFASDRENGSFAPWAATAAVAAMHTANAATEAAVSFAEASSALQEKWNWKSKGALRRRASEAPSRLPPSEEFPSRKEEAPPWWSVSNANRLVSAEYAASYASARTRERVPSVPEELLHSPPRGRKTRLTLTPSLEAVHARKPLEKEVGSDAPRIPPAVSAPSKSSLALTPFFGTADNAAQTQLEYASSERTAGHSPDLLNEMERQKRLLQRIERQLAFLRGTAPSDGKPLRNASEQQRRPARSPKAISTSSDLIRRATLDAMLLKAKLQLALLEMETRRLRATVS